MEDEQPDAGLKIGDVARRTGVTVRTLRYWEEIGLLPPSERLAGGHRVYGEGDIRRLHRINLLRHVGVPLAQVADALNGPPDQLAAAVEHHLGVLDQRLVAMGRLRERVRAVGQSLRGQPGGPDDGDLVDVLEGLGEMDPHITGRLTLLVYDDIEAVHDHLVTVFGFGPGRLDRDDAGRVVHGEMHIGDGVIWLHPSTAEHQLASPASLGVTTHSMAVMVDDVDAHCARARAAGADIVSEPRDEPYGYREYDARDLEGGLWSFMSPLEGEDDG